jgi:hypothetical protein
VLHWLIDYRIPICLTLAALFVLGRMAWQNGWLSNLRMPSLRVFDGGDAERDDAADFAALALLRERFDEANCAEGLAACDAALRCFFHGEARA